MPAVGKYNTIQELLDYTNPLVSGGGQLEDIPPLAECVAKLTDGVNEGASLGFQSVESKKFEAVIAALHAPYDDLEDAFSDLFDLNDSDVEEDDDAAKNALGGVADYASGLIDALQNPIAGILNRQSSRFRKSLNRLGEVFVGSGQDEDEKSVYRGVFDRVKFLLTQLLWSEQTSGSELGGLVWYAVSDAIPAINSEIRMLQRMKRLVRSTYIESSTLPPNMIPHLPTFTASIQLCEAEQHLDRVAYDLRANARWNKSEFNQATDDVCDASFVMESGTIPSDAKEWIKGATGWDDRQLNAVLRFKFLPNAKYEMGLNALATLNAFVQSSDIRAVKLHRNLLNLVNVLEGLLSFDIGDVLALIVEVLRNQLSALRADMEANLSGFSANFDPLDNEAVAKENAGTDLASVLAAQAAAFSILYALCQLMRRVQGISRSIENLIEANNQFVRKILEFAKFYAGDTCGDDEGAKTINLALTNYLDLSRRALRGDRLSPARLQKSAETLVSAIDSHLDFLTCVRNNLAGGNKRIIETGSLGTSIIASGRNLYNLVRNYPEMARRVKELWLGSVDDEKDYLTKIVEGLQCMIAQCDNSYLNSIAVQAEADFQEDIDRRYTKRLSSGELDKVPAMSRKSSLGIRSNAFFRIFQALQQLTSLDLERLCAQPPEEAPQTEEEKERDRELEERPAADEPDDTALRAMRERQARADAADKATPLSDAPSSTSQLG